MSVNLIALLVIVGLLMLAWLSWTRTGRTSNPDDRQQGMTANEVAEALGYAPRDAPSKAESEELKRDVEAWREKNADLKSERIEPVIAVEPVVHPDTSNITDSDIDDHLRRVLRGDEDNG